MIDLSQLSFHHIGVACKDLGMETDKLKILGYAREGDDFIDPIQGVKGRFLSGQMPRLELLVPLYPDSVLSPWLESSSKMYHKVAQRCIILLTKLTLLKVLSENFALKEASWLSNLSPQLHSIIERLLLSCCLICY